MKHSTFGVKKGLRTYTRDNIIKSVSIKFIYHLLLGNTVNTRFIVATI
jgi:hypothetical protein